MVRAVVPHMHETGVLWLCAQKAKRVALQLAELPVAKRDTRDVVACPQARESAAQPQPREWTERPDQAMPKR